MYGENQVLFTVSCLCKYRQISWTEREQMKNSFWAGNIKICNSWPFPPDIVLLILYSYKNMYLNLVQLLTPEPLDKMPIIISPSCINWKCRGLENRVTTTKREGKTCLNTAHDPLPLLLPRRLPSLTTSVGCHLRHFWVITSSYSYSKEFRPTFNPLLMMFAPYCILVGNGCIQIPNSVNKKSELAKNPKLPSVLIFVLERCCHGLSY